MMNQGFNQNNYTFPSAPADGWDDRECPSWMCDFSISKPHIPVNVDWPNGEPKLVNLKTGELVPPAIDFEKEAKEKAEAEESEKYNKQKEEDVKRAQLEFFAKQVSKMTLEEVGKLFRANDLSCEKQKEIVNTVFISKLPRFSTAMLKRMQAATELASKAQADEKFYTWKKGVTASNTSHTAWGHRRNGGGKGKQETVSIKDTSEKAKLAKAAAKRVRQENNKEKREKEMIRHKEVMVRLTEQKKALEEKEVKEAEEVKEETDEEKQKREKIEAYNEFKREELDSFRVKVVDISYETSKNVTNEPVEEGWKKVTKVASKQEKKAAQLTQMFYENKPEEETIIEKAVKKVSWTKAKKATLMCRSVAKGEKCPHPSGKCNFAHNPEELSPKNCANGGCCKFIQRIGSKYINKGKKVCAYLHEGETKSNLCNRIGVKMEEVICKTVTIEKMNTLQMTPLSTRVLKPYSPTQAWGPVV